MAYAHGVSSNLPPGHARHNDQVGRIFFENVRMDLAEGVAMKYRQKKSDASDAVIKPVSNKSNASSHSRQGRKRSTARLQAVSKPGVTASHDPRLIARDISGVDLRNTLGRSMSEAALIEMNRKHVAKNNEPKPVFGFRAEDSTKLTVPAIIIFFLDNLCRAVQHHKKNSGPAMFQFLQNYLKDTTGDFKKRIRAGLTCLLKLDLQASKNELKLHELMAMQSTIRKKFRIPDTLYPTDLKEKRKLRTQLSNGLDRLFKAIRNRSKTEGRQASREREKRERKHRPQPFVIGPGQDETALAQQGERFTLEDAINQGKLGINQKKKKKDTARARSIAQLQRSKSDATLIKESNSRRRRKNEEEKKTNKVLNPKHHNSDPKQLQNQYHTIASKMTKILLNCCVPLYEHGSSLSPGNRYNAYMTIRRVVEQEIRAAHQAKTRWDLFVSKDEFVFEWEKPPEPAPSALTDWLGLLELFDHIMKIDFFAETGITYQDLASQSQEFAAQISGYDLEPAIRQSCTGFQSHIQSIRRSFIPKLTDSSVRASIERALNKIFRHCCKKVSMISARRKLQESLVSKNPDQLKEAIQAITRTLPGLETELKSAQAFLIEFTRAKAASKQLRIAEQGGNRLKLLEAIENAKRFGLSTKRAREYLKKFEEPEGNMVSLLSSESGQNKPFGYASAPPDPSESARNARNPMNKRQIREQSPRQKIATMVSRQSAFKTAGQSSHASSVDNMIANPNFDRMVKETGYPIPKELNVKVVDSIKGYASAGPVLTPSKQFPRNCFNRRVMKEKSARTQLREQAYRASALGGHRASDDNILANPIPLASDGVEEPIASYNTYSRINYEKFLKDIKNCPTDSTDKKLIVPYLQQKEIKSQEDLDLALVNASKQHLRSLNVFLADNKDSKLRRQAQQATDLAAETKARRAANPLIGTSRRTPRRKAKHTTGKSNKTSQDNPFAGGLSVRRLVSSSR